MEPFCLALITLLAITGAFVQSTIGLGYVMVVAPFLMLVDPDFVPVPMLLSGLFLSLLVVWRDRKTIDFAGIKAGIYGRILGNLIAVRLIIFISSNTFMILFGVLVIVAVWLSTSRFDLRPTPVNVGVAGIFSGIMGTLAGLGGPPMAILYQNEQGSLVRGTLSGYFILGSCLSLLFLGIADRITLNALKLFVYTTPGILIGFCLSKYAIGFIDKGHMKKALLAVSSLAAVTVVAKALMALVPEW